MIRSNLLHSGSMLLGVLCFALAAALMKFAAESFSVYEIIFYRSLLGIVLTYMLVRRAQISIKPSRPWAYFFRCLCGTTCILLNVYAVWKLPLGTAQTLNYTAPLFFAVFLLIESIYLHQSLSKSLLTATVFGFLGILLIARPDIDPNLALPMAVGLFAGACGAGGDWYIRYLTHRGEPGLRVVFYFVLSGTVAGFIGACLDGFHPMDTIGALELIGIGFFGTIGQYAITHAWKNGVAILNCVYQYFGVIFALIIGTLCFNDSLDTLTLSGIAIVCLSGIFASLMTRKLEQQTK